MLAVTVNEKRSKRVCWMLEAGGWMLGAGYWMLGAGCWMLDAGCWMLEVRFSCHTEPLEVRFVRSLGSVFRVPRTTEKESLRGIC